MKLVLLGVGRFFKGYVSFRECNMTETEYFFLEGKGKDDTLLETDMSQVRHV